MAVDWLALKTEYITTDTSYRKLAKKYGPSVTQICNRSKAEHWQEQREQHLNGVFTETISKEQSKAVDRYTRLTTVADKLLVKIESAVDALDDENLMKLLSPTVLRGISGALKDIKDIQSLKGDRDLREQDARIRKLEMEAREDSASSEIKIVFTPEMEAWSE